ncbi:MAG: FAD:protein FMN transferase [Streptococcaceae bacterium]|jgi:thiamine biosynthesis lipoprotein|nr:FAD:protein FMN transferase [Streptococcaceae bacterium]
MALKSRTVKENTQMATLVYMGMGTAFTTQIVLRAQRQLVEIEAAQAALENWLWHVEEVFSPFLPDSEVSRYNLGALDFLTMSEEMRFVYVSCEQAKVATHGAFDAYYQAGKYNPSGFVKGWAIEEGFKRFLKPLLEFPDILAANLNGGGDMQMETREDADWTFGIGVVDPRDKLKMIAEIPMKTGAIATSGIAERGQHIAGADKTLLQTTVIGQSLQEVDVWATALIVSADSELPRHLTGFSVTTEGKINRKGTKNA